MTTNINTTLLSAIQTTLGSTITPSLTSTSASSDIFEAYIFSLVLEAARIEGANIAFQNVNGSIPSTFVFRTSPGYIFSNVHSYTHAIIDFPNRPTLEAHIGIRVSGKSGVLHECDVAVLYQAEAATCRLNGVSPRSSRVIIGIECKFYSSTIPLGLARSFIGLGLDLSAQDCYFVVNTSSSSAEKLLAKKRRGYGINIFPSSNVNVERLRNNFQQSFDRFKAKNG
jgi:hypothetical protein